MPPADYFSSYRKKVSWGSPLIVLGYVASWMRGWFFFAGVTFIYRPGFPGRYFNSKKKHCVPWPWQRSSQPKVPEKRQVSFVHLFASKIPLWAVHLHRGFLSRIYIGLCAQGYKYCAKRDTSHSNSPTVSFWSQICPERECVNGCPPICS